MNTSHQLAYLATPYSQYPHGILVAWQVACRLAGQLIKMGINVYSPIAHMHGIAHCSGIDPLDHDLWMRLDQAMMERCNVLLVAHMEGWNNSKGVSSEVAEFERVGKPVFDLDPRTMVMTRREKCTHSPPGCAPRP